jgi:hypothetical protein
LKKIERKKQWQPGALLLLTCSCNFFWNWMFTRCGCAPSDLTKNPNPNN